MSDKLKQNLTLGSLFSGSGGFELAGLLCGIKPLFASEIEPFPIRVTTKRMPFVKHLGDINKIDGSKIDPVDVITFGSPCQNLSVFIQSVAHTLCATDWKDPPIACYKSSYYIIRKITPTECARLQGFPDWWCSELETEEPTKEDIEFWTNVFEDHRRVVTKAKRKKSEKQIIKWLKNPCLDSAQYRMWGNAVALPNALFVLAGIVWASNLSDSD